VIELADSLVVATLKRGTLPRRVVAWVLAVVGSWAVARGLVPIRTEVGLTAVLLYSLILVMVVAAIGGLCLTGIKDRVESFAGQLKIESAAGAGTTLHVESPDVPALGVLDERAGSSEPP
jgi:hypothetical protein